MMQAGFADTDFICYVSIAEIVKTAPLNQPLRTCQFLISHVHATKLKLPIIRNCPLEVPDSNRRHFLSLEMGGFLMDAIRNPMFKSTDCVTLGVLR